MSHGPISSKEPIRLFKSDFVEFFTHIHPAVIVALWLPVVVFFLVRAILAVEPGASWIHIPVGLLLGVFIWTFAEYMLHRFLFHFRPRNPWQERVSFLFHGVHHAQPMSKTRLVMPPPVSIPLALFFYGLYWFIVAQLLGAAQWVAPLFAGFIAGYLWYDLTHYALHHFPAQRGYYKMVRLHHMRHHGKDPHIRYGVSSPLWDYVFRTMPK